MGVGDREGREDGDSEEGDTTSSITLRTRRKLPGAKDLPGCAAGFPFSGGWKFRFHIKRAQKVGRLEGIAPGGCSGSFSWTRSHAVSQRSPAGSVSRGASRVGSRGLLQE